MPKIWKLKSKMPEELSSVYEDRDPLIAQLLYNRGLIEKSKIEEFLNPQYERLHSPFLFKDMQKAVERIWQAIEQHQKITIYGDYDADAVTANAVLRQTFKYLNHQYIDSYIPDRFAEGYGVNMEAVARIKKQESSLIITVDCGTNSREVADYCRSNGIDLIITDHHEVIGELPDAYAVINPKNPNDNYPDSNITGVGVAFKLACAMLSNAFRIKDEGLNIIYGWEKWLLDLVAIGTVADCHDLLGENRILVKYGLVVLQKTKWPGLRALMLLAGLIQEEGGPLQKRAALNRAPDVYTLGFILAPRLNAAGRLEHANIALDLLLEEEMASGRQKAQALNELNRRRQETTERILSEAREQALVIRDRKIIVMMSENWHKGVVGLVAGRIAEEFSKPTIVLQMEGEEATGSARSVGEFDIVAALKYSENHLVRFGGHKQAAGLTLRGENFEIFYQTILSYAQNHIKDEYSSAVLELESELTESQLSTLTQGAGSDSRQSRDLRVTILQLLQKLEPFGAGNPRPKFLIKNAEILSQRTVGSSGQHLQLQIRVGEKIIPAIAFNFRPVDSLQPVNIACELMQDEWNGRKQVKLKILDVKMSKN